MLLGLQRTRGNAAVQRFLHPDPPLQREADVHDARPAVPIQRNGIAAGGKPKSVAVGLLEANRDNLETVRAEGLVRMGKLSLLERDTNDAIGAVKGQLLAVSKTYDAAYKRYADVIAKAKQEAQSQQEWTDIFVGIAIGVLVGVCIEGVAAAVAVDAVATVAAKGLKALAKTAAKEAGGEVVEAGGGVLAKVSGAFEVAGKDLEPGGLKPEILKMTIWKELTKLHEQAPRIGGQALNQALLMSNAEYAIGEIKAHVSGGKGADLSEDDAVKLAVDVLAGGKSAKDVDKAIDTAREKFAAMKKQGGVESTYTADQMEKDIWVLWMASLKKDSNILDIDAIEKHLAALGLVDFGSYTSDDDENEAIDAARGKASAIRKRRDAAMSGGGTAPPP